MARPRLRIYTDYKSPFAYIANKRLFEIEQEFGLARFNVDDLAGVRLLDRVGREVPHDPHRIEHVGEVRGQVGKDLVDLLGQVVLLLGLGRIEKQELQAAPAECGARLRAVRQDEARLAVVLCELAGD